MTEFFLIGSLLAHIPDNSPGSLSDRYVVQISESQKVRVEIMQLENTSQKECGRKQNACKQLHRVVPLQTQVTKTGGSHGKHVCMCTFMEEGRGCYKVLINLTDTKNLHASYQEGS